MLVNIRRSPMVLSWTRRVVCASVDRQPRIGI